ncbi:hypothetical protein PCH_Pc22g17050 [Penicillium rubens Wisconsin 54-1255]|uniref:Uncharacterized protein n=1 Tax=Penicillium rubens (strain ATCC 28089 / DSM 1075 / NRRL 1951 / Wisconsin 54-1255) TaxID=500485 RepID=B6HSC9_PENRW|nr:hypothetical protein PCH_Pc22g17050 [Penicillium rubens Wisconsin 54-1255]
MEGVGCQGARVKSLVATSYRASSPGIRTPRLEGLHIMPDSRTRALSNFHADAATQNAGTKFPQGWKPRSSTKGCCESLARIDVRCRSTAFHNDGAFFVFPPISGGGAWSGRNTRESPEGRIQL